MNESPEQSDLFQRVHDFVMRSTQSTLSPEEHGDLQELLRTSEEARAMYVSYAIESSGLRSVAESGTFDAALQSTPTESENWVNESSAVIIDVKSDTLSRRKKQFDSIHWQRHKIRFNAMTAILTALAWVGFSFFVWLTTTPDDSRPNRDGVDVNFVARITGQYDHRWAEGMREMPSNAFLVPGERLNLVEGLIEITFHDGAKVVLEGPVEFVIDSRGAGTLEVGRLGATVPPQATGFTIHTEYAQVVDLGTEFGVEVDQTGATEVVVFEGEIEFAPCKGQGAAASAIKLTAGQAARRTGPNAPISTITPGTQFVRLTEASRRFAIAATSELQAGSTAIPDGDLEITGAAHSELWLQMNGSNSAWQPGSGNTSYTINDVGGAALGGGVSSAHSGDIAGWASGDRMHQVLTATFEQGKTYDLQYYVGARAASGNATHTLYLFRGDNLAAFLAGGSGLSSDSYTPLDGSTNWTARTTSYTATAADHGKAIGVATSMSSTRGWWDTMTLEVTSADVAVSESISGESEKLRSITPALGGDEEPHETHEQIQP